MYELYALDALEGEGRAALAAHLARGCPRCSAAVAEARYLVAQLVWLAPTLWPPARLRRSLLRLADAEPPA